MGSQTKVIAGTGRAVREGRRGQCVQERNHRCHVLSETGSEQHAPGGLHTIQHQTVPIHPHLVQILRLALAGEAGRRLTAGMNVEVEITVSDTAAARGFSVPLSAVFRNGGEACVWVLAADSTVRKRPVRLGGTDGAGRALVRSGLTGGEQLVEMGTGALQEGEKVCPVPAPGESNVGGLL